MPIKKFLKIAGLILLFFLILYAGLMIVLAGLGKTAFKAASDNSVAGSMGIFQTSLPLGAPAPSKTSGKIYSAEIAMDSSSVAGAAGRGPVISSTNIIDKKIIKTGNLSLKVEKTDTAAESITNIARLNKGEVSDSNFYDSGRGTKSGSITVRVPFQNFDAVFSEIKKVSSQVISEVSNAQDITEQYIDLEARLKNAQAEEASFVALLNRSGKIEEILAVTREVARVRGEIEQLTGQMRYLNSQTDMSTITVYLSEDVEIATAGNDWRPWQVVKGSVKQLITVGQNFVDGLIGFIIVVLPLLLIYALIIWLIYRLARRVYNHYKSKF